MEIQQLCGELITLLRTKGMTLAAAESCTGGLIGKSLTDISGASEVFGFGFITYANEAKERLLGVKHETLAAFGAVSRQTALEMAEGARAVSGADIAVSVTGIAGPGGGTPEKPVGLVYVGISDSAEARAYKLNLRGSRAEIRRQTCMNALSLVYEAIK